jgi:uncharacterized protein YbjT (DUF2867 family)
VGASTIKHLLAINRNINITIVSREDSRAEFPSSPQITLKKGSYDDLEFLESTFEGQDLVMLVISVWADKSVQLKLIDAAAKVRSNLSEGKV